MNKNIKYILFKEKKLELFDECIFEEKQSRRNMERLQFKVPNKLRFFKG